jgi:large subunit ribosomal protein L31
VPPWSETKACKKETNKMKTDIHPNYVECTVKCSCGNTFTTHSTKPELRIDICNECHPFYTGTQKLIDTGGRVQRFADRFGNATDAVAQREAARKAARAAETAQREADKKAAREAKAAEKAARAAKFAEEAAAKQAEAAVEAEAAEAEAVEAVEAVAEEAAAE